MEGILKILENYECDGQMEIEDFLQKDEEDKNEVKQDVPGTHGWTGICKRDSSKGRAGSP